MGLDSNRDAGAANARLGRRRLRPGESSDWNTRIDEAALSQPHPRSSAQVQRRLDLAPSPPQLTMRRRQPSPSRTLDVTARSTMPPWSPQLARAASDAYRRPRGTLLDYDDEDESASDQPHERRSSSPPRYPPRRLMPGAYSEPSSHASPSVSSYGKNEDDDDGLEVEEVMGDDSSSRHSQQSRQSRQSMQSRQSRKNRQNRQNRQRSASRDEYIDSSTDRNRYRQRFARRYSSDNDRETEPPQSASEMASTARDSSRARERSESPRKAHRYQLTTHVIEDSRPPVASKRPSRRDHRSSESVNHDPHPRRSSTIRSSRSLNGSTSGPARILGTIFGASPPRRSSPDKFFKMEKHVRPEKPRKTVDCVICMEEVSSSKGADLKCGHRMCNSCLKRIFEMSIHDPQHMPPRCCTKSHIPLKHVDRLFDNSFKRTWNRRFAEFSTRNRIYCPSKRCGEWIKPANIQRGEDGRKVARCGRCKTKVCPKCNGKWHASPECPGDEEMTRFLDQANEEGWKRCYRCKAMVELQEGCNHMTCRCGAEFCMICGVKWKGCSCPWFNYDNGENPFDNNNPLRDLNISTEDLRRILRSNRPISMEELRAYSRPTTSIPVRARPQTYEEEMLLRRLQEQRDADLARRLQLSEDHEDEDEDEDENQNHNQNHNHNHNHNQNPFDRARGAEEAEGFGSYSNTEDYRRTSMLSLPAPAPPTQPPPPYTSYVSEVNRARGQRGRSMERRLADRLSENRPGRQSRGPSPLAPALRPHVVHPRSPTMAHAPDMGMSMAMGMGMGMVMGMGRGAPMPVMAPPPPYAPGPAVAPPPMMRPNPFGDGYYNDMYSTPRSVHDPYHYGGEDIGDSEMHSPRRRGRREERPKSSTLAGLTGYGRGMHRVFEWRNFVEPGVPEEG